MNEKFHNPYHFVPVTDDPEKKMWQPCDVFLDSDDKASGHWSHKRYADIDHENQPVYHGRIVCRLTTVTPIFIGAKRIKDGTDDAPAEVLPFELDGRPAIPASSLRGVISSVAEAASNSALRVLENKALSRRMEMKKESMNALGMLRKKAGSEELELWPLTLPLLPCDANGTLKRKVPKAWEKIFNIPNLKVYINGYKPDQDRSPKVTPHSFLDKENPLSFSSNNIQYWYMKLGNTQWKMAEGQKRISTALAKIKKITTRNGPIHFLAGQVALQEDDKPICHAKYEQLTYDKKEHERYTKGILRIFGIEGRERQIPEGKTHEIFIPMPEGINSNQPLNVDDALKKFHLLSDLRSEKDESLPFTLKGRNRGKDASKVRLQENDIVFFKLKDENSDQPAVDEIAIASIWRKQIRGTVFDYFSPPIEKEKNEEMLPFHRERTKISPAEMVFGFVEHRKNENNSQHSEKDKHTKAYAGRVRFSHGIFKSVTPGECCYEHEIILKILDSPKPPSPAFYFTQRASDANPSYISKKELDPEKHKPQGRKFYLHKYNNDEKPWESKITEGTEARFKQKVKITPIPKGRTFWFHIDFDNLNTYELGMLLYALQPNEKFQHKIGMGKPLGLGSVKIEPIALHFIDRLQRYMSSDLFHEARYTESFTLQPEIWKDRPEIYKDESKESIHCTHIEIQKFFENIMRPEIKHALETIGNPQNVEHRVHTPLQHSQTEKNEELETFKWFVKNDHPKNPKKQFLRPINAEDESSETLSPLHRNEGK